MINYDDVSARLRAEGFPVDERDITAIAALWRLRKTAIVRMRALHIPPDRYGLKPDASVSTRPTDHEHGDRGQR